MEQKIRNYISICLATSLLILTGCGSSDSSPEPAAATPEVLELDWGRYGPFDELSTAARQLYPGKVEAGDVTAVSISHVVESITQGFFSQPENLASAKTHSGRRAVKPATLFDGSVLDTSGDFWNWASSIGNSCSRSNGEVNIYHLEPKSNTQRIHLKLVEYKSCTINDITLDGYVYISSDRENPTSGEYYIAYDGLDISSSYTDFRVIGTASVKNSSACNAAKSVNSTLYIENQIAVGLAPFENVLLEDFTFEWRDGIESKCDDSAEYLASEDSKFDFNTFNGDVYLGHSGKYSIETELGMSRHYDMRYLTTAEYSPEFLELQNRPMNIFGADNYTASFNFEWSGLSLDGPAESSEFLPEEYFAVIEITPPDNGDLEVYRSTYNDYQDGAMSDLTDLDQDDMPDSWEYLHSLSVYTLPTENVNQYEDWDDFDLDGRKDLEEYQSLSRVDHKDREYLSSDYAVAASVTHSNTVNGYPTIAATADVSRHKYDIRARHVTLSLALSTGYEWRADNLAQGCTIQEDNRSNLDCDDSSFNFSDKGTTDSFEFYIETVDYTVPEVTVTATISSTAFDRDTSNNVATASAEIILDE